MTKENENAIQTTSVSEIEPEKEQKMKLPKWVYIAFAGMGTVIIALVIILIVVIVLVVLYFVGTKNNRRRKKRRKSRVDIVKDYSKLAK